jgi:RNA polymerase sigma-70 factor (ECF subfamily)
LTEHSFTDALQRNGQRLYLLALSFTGSRQDAEDILQNTFLKLWQSSERFTDSTHMDKWLTRVVVNESRSLLRRHRLRLRKRRSPSATSWRNSASPPRLQTAPRLPI